LGEAQNVISFGFKRMTIRSSRSLKRRVKVATDGEIVWMNTPLEFSVSPHPLYLLKPGTTPEPGILDTGSDA
jgi:hypothetical protein